MTTPLISIHRRSPSDQTKTLGASTARVVKPSKPTPSAPLIISVSELRDFLRCRVRWHFRHQLRLEPKQGSEALSIGSLEHEILETWYKLAWTRRTVKSMERIARARVAATTRKALDATAKDLVVAMSIGYASWTLAKTNDVGDAAIGFVKGEAEEWFEFPLADDRSIMLRGKFDNRFISRTLKKTMALLEFKTAASIRLSKFEQNLQTTGYLAALRHLYPGYRRYLVYPTVLRKQAPGPRVRADLFAREPFERTDGDLDRWIIDARRAALDMLDAAVYPHPTDSCEWDCDFRMPCLLRGTPSDVKHVLTTEYQPKERT